MLIEDGSITRLSEAAGKGEFDFVIARDRTLAAASPPLAHVVLHCGHESRQRCRRRELIEELSAGVLLVLEPRRRASLAPSWHHGLVDDGWGPHQVELFPKLQQSIRQPHAL